MEGSCERDNDPSGSIKYGEFLEQLSLQLASQDGFCCMELVRYDLFNDAVKSSHSEQ
jgi:hypothetical protein